MSESTPLDAIGRGLTMELATEVAVPLVLAGAGWWVVVRVLSAAVPGAGLTPLEIGVLFAACVALTGWATGRQLYLYGRRSPHLCVLWGAGIVTGMVLIAPPVIRGRFENACTKLQGVVVDSETVRLCRVGGLPGNIYLPGTLYRTAWSGQLPVGASVGLIALGGLASLGLRQRRIFRTRVAVNVLEGLRLAPAAGPGAVIGPPSPKNLKLQACGNATLWGELCGQLYAAERVFEPGEWCLRCSQVFRPVDRELTFRVVTLFSADVDVLNGLERVDTVSWPQGEVMPPDARLSAQERWVVLGTVTIPDVLTVAQTLAFVHAEMGGWGKADPKVEAAIGLASTRASRVHCWFWQGETANRLTWARPTPRAVLALGSARLRDLGLDSGEELTLQLDIGYFPLELRVGFRKTFLDERRGAEVQNSKQNLWIPVAPPELAAEDAGVWVPRIEGEALRVWLATEQGRADEVRGSTVPLPYRPEGDPDAGKPTRGSLDFVRIPVDPERNEPVAARPPGASISEWRWFEAEQIILLRRDALVLVEAPR